MLIPWELLLWNCPAGWELLKEFSPTLAITYPDSLPCAPLKFRDWDNVTTGSAVLIFLKLFLSVSPFLCLLALPIFKVSCLLVVDEIRAFWICFDAAVGSPPTPADDDDDDETILGLYCCCCWDSGSTWLMFNPLDTLLAVPSPGGTSSDEKAPPAFDGPCVVLMTETELLLWMDAEFAGTEKEINQKNNLSLWVCPNMPERQKTHKL